MITVTVDTAAIERELGRLLEKTGNFAPAFKEIGEDLTESIKQRFSTATAPDGTPWARNQPSTIRRKGYDKPLVGETKSLSREIHYQITGNTLEVGSTMEYAATQQFGAKRGAHGRTRRGAPIPWGDIPPRPFIGLSAEDEANIHDVIKAHLEG